MKSLQVFYQLEGAAGVDHLEFPDDATFADLIKTLVGKHGVDADTLLFVQDGEEPVGPEGPLASAAHGGAVKVQAHRCKRINVSVTFNGRTVSDTFAPGTTVGRLKKWAAEKQFHMSPDEAGEHVLQIAGTQDRPAPNVHVGSLATHPACHVTFDLVPNERVNGADEVVS